MPELPMLNCRKQWEVNFVQGSSPPNGEAVKTAVTTKTEPPIGGGNNR